VSDSIGQSSVHDINGGIRRKLQLEEAGVCNGQISIRVIHTGNKFVNLELGFKILRSHGEPRTTPDEFEEFGTFDFVETISENFPEESKMQIVRGNALVTGHALQQI